MVNIKPNDDMTNIGWAKTMTIKYPFIKNKKVYCQEVDFYVKDFQCEGCKTNEFLWLVRNRHYGVGLACCFCRTYDAQLSINSGIPRKTKEITVQEAIEIFKRKGLKETDHDLRPYYKLLKKDARKSAQRKRPSELKKFETKDKSKKDDKQAKAEIDEFAEALEELS